MKASHVAFVLSLLALPVAACAVEDESSTESSESELRALTSAEIVGSIAYGETKTVAYTRTPLYRAFSFQAQKGDEIDARFVGAGGVDPVGYLLSSTFATVKRNDDESTASNASHFTHVISKAGTYYLVVKSAKPSAGDVTISLTREGAAPPQNSGDPFSASSCSGAPITSAQLMAMLDPSRGVLEKKVGRFTVHRRDRACYAGLSCSEWRAGGISHITAPFSRLNATFSTASDAGNYLLNPAGDVSVSFVANSLRVSLDGDLHESSWGASFTPSFLKQGLNVGILTPSNADTTANVNVKYTYMPSLGCPNGHCQGNSSIPGSEVAKWAGKDPVVLTGKVTASCLRFAASSKQDVVDGNGNSYSLESDLVFAGDFANATCQAKTCAEANSTCGSIPDGCGGTLNCGSCGTNQTCQPAETGNACRPMTAQEQCSASGRVFCPGHSGCWDACS